MAVLGNLLQRGRLAGCLVRTLSKDDRCSWGERFGQSNGDSGWRWPKEEGGSKRIATEIKPGVGKGLGTMYKMPEYFGHDIYSFYDMEKEIVESGLRLPQPRSGLTEWWGR